MRSTSRKKPYMLLEVLIALMIISLCFIPVLTPLMMLYHSQRELVDAAKLDRWAAQEMLTFKQRLYQQKIDVAEFPVVRGSRSVKDGQGLRVELDQEAPLSAKYTAYFECFRMEKSEGQYAKIFANLHVVRSKGKSRKYCYQIAAERVDDEA
ncbi:MAG: hypothetical protein ACQEP8_03780 [Chlamydiota bacterium]